MRAFALGLLLFAAAGSGWAEESTPEKFGDWGLYCVEPGGEESSAKICTLFQRLIRQEGGEQIARAEISAPPDQQNAKMLITVPLGVGLQAGAGLQVDEGELLKSPYSFCSKVGCHALFNLDDELVSAMKKGLNLTIYFVAVKGQTLKAPLSLKGVTAGLAALAVRK